MRSGRAGCPLVVVAALAWAVAATPAWANPPDLFGLGASSMGRGGAGLALDGDGFAAWRNPASLALSEGARIDLGLHLGVMRFRCFDEPVSRAPLTCPSTILWDGNRDGVVDAGNPFDRWHPPEDAYTNPHGARLGVIIPFRRWLRVGVSVGLPVGRLLRIEQEDPFLPYYIRWKNRPQRLSLHVGASVRIVEGLSVGVGASVLARARLKLGFIIDARVSDDELSEEDGVLAVDFIVNPWQIEVDVRPALSPVAGVTWDLGSIHEPLEGIRLGVVYRHPIDLLIDPTELTLDLFGVVDDVGSLEDILVPLEASVLFSILDFSTPRQVAVGLAWNHSRFALALDLTWHQWSAVLPNVARVDEQGTDVAVGLFGLDPQVLNARDFTPLDFRDTLSLRVGGEVRPPPAPLTGRVGARFREVGVQLRAGYSYEPSFVPEQTGRTSFLDNDTHAVTVGAGLWTWEPFELTGGTVHLDLFAQLHLLEARVHTKAAVDAEAVGAGWPVGGAIDSGGLVFIAGGDLSLRFGAPPAVEGS